MRQHCPRSCEVCTEADTECKDKSEDCKGWGESHQCTENPTFMVHECPETCGACETLCLDQHDDCKNWAKDGACEKNHAYMLASCPVSCGTCARHRAAIKYGDGPDWPTESQPHDEV